MTKTMCEGRPIKEAGPKTLGQIDYEGSVAYYAELGLHMGPWEALCGDAKAAREAGAQAVATRVRAECAKQLRDLAAKARCTEDPRDDEDADVFEASASVVERGF